MLQEPEIWPEAAASGSAKPKKATDRRNVVTNYLSSIVIVVVGFVTTPILTHQLGIVRYGVWALLGSLIPFLELLELGVASTTVAFVSRHLELEDDEKVGASLNTSFLVLSVFGIIAFAGVVVFAIFLPDIVTSIPKILVGQARFLVLLLAFDMAVSIPDGHVRRSAGRPPAIRPVELQPDRRPWWRRQSPGSSCSACTAD